MRILITGSKGFIGRYLCTRLAKEDGLTTQGIDLTAHYSLLVILLGYAISETGMD